LPEYGFLGRRLVQMERLRIEIPGEADDIVPVERDAAQAIALPRRQIL